MFRTPAWRLFLCALETLSFQKVVESTVCCELCPFFEKLEETALGQRLSIWLQNTLDLGEHQMQRPALGAVSRGLLVATA